MIPPFQEYMGDNIDGVKAIPLRNYVDDRGHLCVLAECGIHLDGLDNEIWRVYMTTAGKGVIKAWHEHRKQSDRMAVVSGKVKIGLRDMRDDSPTRGNMIFAIVGPLNPHLIVIPPNVQHGFMPLEDNSIVINMPDMPYDSSDEIRHEPNPQHWIVRNG